MSAQETTTDDIPLCPEILENDASEGGKGIVRCDAFGEFSEDRTSWTCIRGHVIEPIQYCIVYRCPCRLLSAKEPGAPDSQAGLPARHDEAT